MFEKLSSTKNNRTACIVSLTDNKDVYRATETKWNESRALRLLFLFRSVYFILCRFMSVALNAP